MILCCGEALIDMIPSPTVAGPDGFVPHCGGAIFNTAIALGRLGIGTGMLTGLSRDIFGQQLRAALEASGVATDLAILSDQPTTLAFVHLTNGHAKYTFYDENSAGLMISPADLPALPDTVTCAYFGGISLCNAPAADSYLVLAERAADQATIMLDPNIRPGFIRDETGYRARLSRMIALADIVKVSDEDLHWLRPGADSLDTKIAAMQQDGGPHLVILTRGAEGATGYLRGGGTVSVPARPAEIVDTVGAGDTFNAGVLASLSDMGLLDRTALHALGEAQLATCLGFAASVAAITVSRSGANPPWRAELSADPDA